ncbi:MAG TPA: hypothetical protein ENK47_05935 [Euryarchaeota archaeon]|nr:MAG: hypothetical protein B6U90_01180 [Thermoplasmatales archaeon ex4484_6]RLF68697.1 MAG: hypothetical protein DRN57_03205 [Thermoplasmata archaeon]HHD16231.1 hypothetical protein [Euryarchaeota archaeon]
MARKKAGKEKVKIVMEDDEDLTDIKGGEVERYEVRIGPPTVSGRKVKAVRSPDSETGGQVSAVSSGRQAVPVAAAGGSSQQIYKIEDDLRRTRDIVEDLRHTVSVMEGEFKDLKGEMERMSYLLRSLEGLRNTMKDIESTVSELSGLYDMISASINPFIDIQPIPPSNGNGVPREAPGSSTDDDGAFRELSEIFEEEEEEELEETEEWEETDLLSEEWALRWTKFLMQKVGKEGLEKTLDYYRNLGWIDDGIIEKVLDIAKGTVGPSRKSDTGKIRWKMDAEDHVKSLEFIRRIKER